MMRKKKWMRGILMLAVFGTVLGVAIGLYMLNRPHRDVEKESADFTLLSSELVNEYLADASSANEKYLAADGESKIIEVKGTVYKLSENYSGQFVVMLKDEVDKAGVSATFIAKPVQNEITVGQTIVLKGVIRSGAAYDEDLEMYEHVILEKCSLINIP